MKTQNTIQVEFASGFAFHSVETRVEVRCDNNFEKGVMSQ